MLRSSKIKLVCLLLCTILLSGCEATYTITINKDTIDEKIEVLSDKEKQLLSSFRKLSPEKQKALIELFAD